MSLCLAVASALAFAAAPPLALPLAPQAANSAAAAPPGASATIVRSIGVGELLARQGDSAAKHGIDLGRDDLARLLQALAVARVDGGEALFAFDRIAGGDAPFEWRLLVRTSATDPAPRGELWLPAHERDRVSGRLARVPFTLPADAQLATDADFAAAEKRRAELLVRLGVAGQPLFAALAEGAPPDAPHLPLTGSEWLFDEPLGRRSFGGEAEFDRTFELFSGGRALQENLQIDRARSLGAGDATIPVESIEGITIAPIDWKARTGTAEVAIEPLAHWVPADQIYASFGSFATLVRLLDELDARGDSLIQLLEPHSEDARTRERLERQLCIGSDALARVLGPTVVRSVAATASDPYLREGSDVTLLFDCIATEPLLLRLALGWNAARSANGACREVASERAGVAIRGLVAPDRSTSSYLAVRGDVVLIGNSLPAIERLLDAQAGTGDGVRAIETHGASDEFRFFRARYPFGGAAASGDAPALLLLSDPFLRRFCGPAWRIGESRRLRCAAVAARLDGLRAAGATADAATLAKERDLCCPGDPAATWRFVAGGARCSVHGGAGFLTPIAEQPVQRVSAVERENYLQFQRRYQQYWRQFFDPIALSIEVGETLRLDLTVLPLIEGTDYDELRDFAFGAGVLAPDAGDAHAGTLLHFITHVNRQSREMQQLAEFAGALERVPGEALAWLGDSVEWFVEEGPFFDGLEQALAADRTIVFDYLQDHFAELPVALSFPIKNPLPFAAFVTSLRAYVESSLPNTLQWESRTHGELSYVVIRPDPRGSLPSGEGAAQLQLCYGSTRGHFWLSPSESVLQRAFDRATKGAATGAGASAETNSEAGAPPASAWLGDHAAVTLDLSRLPLIARLLGSEFALPELVSCYSNLPALEEWRRRAGVDDPVAAHADAFAVQLVCPAGGDYQLDPELHAMTCTKHGHPTAPREPSRLPAALDGLARVAAGLTFEQEGVRIRIEAARKK